MIIGEYKSKLVTGNRIAFPKKFRDELGGKLIVTRGYEGCLVIVDEKGWSGLITDAAKGPFVSQSVRDTTRFLLGGAFEVELDDQGRFVLPPNLRDYCAISEEATFLGLGRWVELWSANSWDERKKYIDDHSSDLGEKLANLKI
ncbi:MAG: cell division/cell wall cluster transcriptional repressor MraZ [Patescibacteria group bacterium]